MKFTNKKIAEIARSSAAALDVVDRRPDDYHLLQAGPFLSAAVHADLVDRGAVIGDEATEAELVRAAWDVTHEVAA